MAIQTEKVVVLPTLDLKALPGRLLIPSSTTNKKHSKVEFPDHRTMPPINLKKPVCRPKTYRETSLNPVLSIDDVVGVNNIDKLTLICKLKS